jgi:hypothetical protein
MIGGSPAPASFDASLAGSTGSFFTSGEITPRPMRSFVLEKAPSGAPPCGNWTTRRSSALSSAPSCKSVAATTTAVVCMFCGAGAWLVTRL